MPTQGVGDAADDDWAGLFAGIEALTGLSALRRAWLAGLSRSSSADVLLRLLGVVNGLPARKLPTEVVDAAIAHPDRRVRMRLAELQRGMSVAQWARLIASEPSGAFRHRLQALAVWYCPNKVTEAEFERWARDPDPHVRLQALWFRGLPHQLAAALAADPDPQVRAAACRYAWSHLDADRRSVLVADTSPQVQQVARQLAGFDQPMSCAHFDTLTPTGQHLAAHSQLLGRDLAEHLVHHPDRGRRVTLAENERLDADLVTALAQDSDPHVRARVAVRPDTTEALRTAISAGLGPDHPYSRVAWVEELHDDPEAMRRLACSASVAIRRSVARARCLPPDVVDRLCHDPDHGVQDNLALCCQDAPGVMLLEVALRRQDAWPARTHPNFPRDTLMRFADDPDPMRRRLALDATDSTSELAERFAADPHEAVRERAAADPRLSPATVVQLLDSTHRTRQAAITNPRLPVPVLVRLLRDPATAETAAGNPILPTRVMHQLIDLACNAD